MRFATLAPLCLISALASTAHAQDVVMRGPTSERVSVPAKGSNVAVASRAAKAPVIDGRADDPSWSTAQVIDGFRVYDPIEDGEPRFKTEARVAYDDRNLYVIVRAFDPHPDSIRALLARRDVRSASDEIKILIDSYHDKRSGFEFAVNPLGVKRDIAIFNDSDEDNSWDAVWPTSLFPRRVAHVRPRHRPRSGALHRTVFMARLSSVPRGDCVAVR
jgi:hypothetical protein